MSDSRPKEEDSAKNEKCEIQENDDRTFVESLSRELAMPGVANVAYQPKRILVARDDPKFQREIKNFEENRIEEDSPAFRVQGSISSRSDVSLSLAMIRFDEARRSQCEGLFAVGAIKNQIHVAPPVVAGNANSDVIARTQADLAFGAMRYASHYDIIVHSGSGNAKVDQRVSEQLTDGRRLTLPAQDWALARHTGGAHNQDMIVLGGNDEVIVNPSDRGPISRKRAFARIKAFALRVVSGFKLRVWSISWGKSGE